MAYTNQIDTFEENSTYDNYPWIKKCMYSSDEQKILQFFRPSELSKIWKDDFKVLMGEFPSEKERVSFEQEKAKGKSFLC